MSIINSSRTTLLNLWSLAVVGSCSTSLDNSLWLCCGRSAKSLLPSADHTPPMVPGNMVLLGVTHMAPVSFHFTSLVIRICLRDWYLQRNDHAFHLVVFVAQLSSQHLTTPSSLSLLAVTFTASVSRSIGFPFPSLHVLFSTLWDIDLFLSLRCLLSGPSPP
jgi:hypothetical protein